MPGRAATAEEPVAKPVTPEEARAAEAQPDTITVVGAPGEPVTGVGADGLYMTVNLFGALGFAGVEVDAFNRAKLVDGTLDETGASNQYQRDMSGSAYSLLPANDESASQTSGTPELFVSDASGLQTWRWSVDWATPANSTLSGPFDVTGAAAWGIAIFGILVSLFERAYLLVYEERMGKQARRLWQSWEDYMREWARRADFRDNLPQLLEGEDEEFAQYIRAENERWLPIIRASGARIE